MLLISESQSNQLSMLMAALMGVVMMLFVVNMFVLMHLSVMLMSMDVFLCVFLRYDSTFGFTSDFSFTI